tara:strand:- start:3877 stop:4686 length:810 start_codon:yes stop_codon:yes gene_type:complete
MKVSTKLLNQKQPKNFSSLNEKIKKIQNKILTGENSYNFITNNSSSNNLFNLEYYDKFIKEAIDNGYSFMTLKEFFTKRPKNLKIFILRHDLDQKPHSLENMLNVERKYSVKSTIFVRPLTNEYNVYGYNTFKMLMNAQKEGYEIGLHTSFVEFSIINKLDRIKVLETELNILRNHFEISGIAPHRDLNYMYNSLPELEKNWSLIKNKFDLMYQGYDKLLFESLTYVNEGFNPHLCWRNITPEEAMKMKQSIYLNTHSHWWFKDQAFEH